MSPCWKRWLPFACVLGALATARAAATQQVSPVGPVAVGQSLRFESRVLGETRTVDVALPAGYERSSARYPVLVVLDGESLFGIAAAIADFYASATQLPPMIVVGVRNVARTRDMTPPAVEGFEPPDLGSDNPGGAPRFLSFLADELLPWIDREYRTVPMRSLVGHSASGLFVVYALAARPSLFTGHLFMDAALWWNNERELGLARAALAQPDARRARVIQVNGPHIGADTTTWGGGSPMVRFISTPGETHVGLPVVGLTRGLRSMFADFLPLTWRAGMRPIEMLSRYDSLAARVGYEVPVPLDTYQIVARMSLDSRFFDDAERVLARMPESPQREQLSARLASERSSPVPAHFIPLEVPARRPTPEGARAFIGRWQRIDPEGGAMDDELDIGAAGDSITVYGRWQLQHGEWDEDFRPVIQLTPSGSLEWGFPVFRGLAAVLAAQGRIAPDGALIVDTEVRGWAPPLDRPRAAPGPATYRFRRVGE